MTSGSKPQTATEKSSSSVKSARKISTLAVKCLKENKRKSHVKKGRSKIQAKEDKGPPSTEVETNVYISKTSTGPGTKVKKKRMGNAVEEKSSLIESVTAQELQIAGIFCRKTM